ALAFLGARLLLVAAGPADGGIELPLVQRLLERLGLHHVGVHGSTVADRADALGEAVRVGPGAQLDPGFLRAAVAERDHLAELPGGVHVQQRDRRPRRMEGLEQQVQQHRAVLADRVHHDRVADAGRDLAQDVDALGLEPVEVGERIGIWGHCAGSWPCQLAMLRDRAGATTVGAAGAAIEGRQSRRGDETSFTLLREGMVDPGRRGYCLGSGARPALGLGGGHNWTGGSCLGTNDTLPTPYLGGYSVPTPIS